MSVATLRPDGTYSNSGAAVTGAASAHAAANDNSDSSYVSDIAAGDVLSLTLGDLTLPADAVITLVEVRWRAARAAAGTSTIRWALSDGPRTTFGIGGVPWIGGTQTVNWSSPSTIGVGGETTWSGGVAFTDTSLDAGHIALHATGGGLTAPEQIRVYELYVDVTYVEKPVVAVSDPTGTIATNTPTVEWTATLDADGWLQTTYEVKVFTAAQYGAVGFDPDTSTPHETSGIVSSAGTSWTPSDVQPDDTYRAYVRVAQTLNDGSLHWSDWDFEDYTVDAPAPAVPTLTLTEDENDGRIVIDLDDNTGTATTDRFELQRSTDGGTTWEPVRLTTDTAGLIAGTSATVYDYEAPNGIATTYRARAVNDLSGASAWATGTVTFSTADVWLKAPERPSLNVVVQVDSYASRQRPARRGVFQPLGATYPIVVRDTRQSWAGTVRFRLDTDEDQAPIDALLDSGLTLLLQVPASFHEPDRYVQMGDQDRGRLADKGFVEGVIDALGWVEVAAPTGVVDAWPAGTS